MSPTRRFAFRLALSLGQPNPDAMLSRMPARIFLEWWKYYQYEPFGEERADLRAGIIASTFANAFRKKGTKAFSPAVFMPKFGPRVKRSGEYLFKKMLAITKLFGGTVIDQRKNKDIPLD